MIGAIHQSDITAFFLCGEAFRRSRIEGEKMPVGIGAKIGQGLHKAAQVNGDKKIITQRDEPLDVLTDAARDGYNQSLADEGLFLAPEDRSGAQKIVDEGQAQAIQLTKVYRDKFAPTVQPVAVEKSFTIIINDLPLPIKGRYDMYGYDAAGETTLVDYKTGKMRMQQDTADSADQLSVYARAVKDYTGEYPASVSFEQFLTQKTNKYNKIRTKRDDSNFAIVIEKIKQMLAMIDAGIFLPAVQGVAGYWKCSSKLCAYWWSCRYIPAHRQVLTTQWQGA
jgi:hypothetical protein